MPSILELFQRVLSGLQLADDEQEDLEQLVTFIPDKATREKVMQHLIENPKWLSQLITIIKRKRRLIGEINEPGWDKVLEDQKKLLKALSKWLSG